MYDKSYNDYIEKRHQMLGLVQNLFDELGNYFKDVGEHVLGKKPSKLTLSDVSSVIKLGRTGLQLISADIESDVGTFTVKLAIKRFSDQKEALRAKIKTQQLESRLSTTTSHSLTRTPAILFSKENIVLYEGILGDTFDDSKIEHEKKLYLTGRALATYHSHESAQVSYERYHYLLHRTIGGIPLPDDKKDYYLALGLKCLEFLMETKVTSGCYAFGDFHSENVMFERTGTKIDKSDEKIYSWIIDPEFAEDLKSADRMEDIATFFIFGALKEFKDTGSIEIVQNDLNTFVRGYNSYLLKYDSYLAKYYDKWSYTPAFLFHLGMNAFIQSFHAAIHGPQQNIERMALGVSLGKHVWKKVLAK